MQGHTTCKNCAHFRENEMAGNGSGNCFLNPPTPVAVPGQHPITNQVQIQFIPVNPPVGPDHWCSSCKPRMAALVS